MIDHDVFEVIEPIEPRPPKPVKPSPVSIKPEALPANGEAVPAIDSGKVIHVKLDAVRQAQSTQADEVTKQIWQYLFSIVLVLVLGVILVGFWFTAGVCWIVVAFFAGVTAFLSAAKS